MMTNLQPLVDALLVTNPPRTIDAGAEAAIKAAITADTGGSVAETDTFYAGIAPVLTTVDRNASL